MIKISLSFFIASLMLFLMAEIFSVLSIADLTKAFFHIGALFLLAAFSLMFIGLMLNAGKQIARGILRYCSGIESRQRRLW
ncbi:MAG: hypothetical protein LUQ57_04500, partial [Methylococcaceae bacterium]|nr:hypothetical protein [Methylococcaceae bacterium]